MMDGGQGPDSLEPNPGEEEEGDTLDSQSLEMKPLMDHDRLPEQDCATLATPMDAIVQITREEMLLAQSFAAPMYREVPIPELREENAEMDPTLDGDGPPGEICFRACMAPMYRTERRKEDAEIDPLDGYQRRMCPPGHTPISRRTFPVRPRSPVGVGAGAPMYNPELREAMFPPRDGDRQILAESSAMYVTTQEVRLQPGDEDSTDGVTFKKEKIFRAAIAGEKSQLHGLLDFLQAHDKQLSSEEFRDEDGTTALMYALLHLKDGKNDIIEELLEVASKTGDLQKLVHSSYNNSDYNENGNGNKAIIHALLHLKEGKNDTIEEILDVAKKNGDLEKIIKTSVNIFDHIDKEGNTALTRALLHLKDGKNDTIEELLYIAKKTGDLEKFINASFNNPDFNGQTALHIAIERRSLNHVKLLVQNGTNVQAKANGEFFQPNAETGFYFGELPLSLAACTNQPEIVSFLINSADLTDRDSQGNTVLHALVVIADNETENTEMFASMYDSILIQHNKLEKKIKDDLKEKDYYKQLEWKKTVQLEVIENNQGFTPLKLAAKLGKIGLFKHMLHREFKDNDTKMLSRKLKGWHYGPVQSSLYDMSSIDTNDRNSVLKIVVYGSDIPNRPEMLQIEPLRSILQDKWDRFASKLFLMNFFLYVAYLIIFTTVAFYRKEGQPPFPLEEPLDYLRCFGELISVLGAVWFLYKGISVFKRIFPNFKALYTLYYDILFLLQALLLLTATVLYFCGQREYHGLLVLSLALAWINVLYYSRGVKQLGIYSVMTQRMILGDLLNFLCVYSVLLFGFSAAVVALIKNSHQVEKNNGTLAEGGSFDVEQSEVKKPSYYSFRFTLMEMFKFTIGMGNLEFTDHVQYKEVFYILLIFYIVLTYILLLNMLIALMGNTVERITQESENIWNLQRALTILDIERTLPMCLKSKLYEKVLSLEKRGDRRFIRVDEIDWKPWRSDDHKKTPRYSWEANMEKYFSTCRWREEMPESYRPQSVEYFTKEKPYHTITVGHRFSPGNRSKSPVVSHSDQCDYGQPYQARLPACEHENEPQQNHGDTLFYGY